MNAADYGVPQIRHRVIIVAFRADLGIDWDMYKPNPSLRRPSSALCSTGGTGSVTPTSPKSAYRVMVVAPEGPADRRPGAVADPA